MGEKSFGTQEVDDFLEEILLPLYRSFLVRSASPRRAVICLTIAYQLYEWTNQARFSEEDFARRYPNEASVACLFVIIRSIVNGTRRFRKHSKATTTTRTQPGVSSRISSSFAKPLVITLDDGSELSAEDLLAEIVGFWKRQINKEFGQDEATPPP